MKDKPHFSYVMVAPIKTVSLLRLELNAAIPGIRVSKSIIKELDLPFYKIALWTESILVLQYLRNGTQCFRTYAANGIIVILQGSSVAQCCHLPSERNPVDMCRRGVASPKYFLKNQRDQLKSWYEGPKCL